MENNLRPRKHCPGVEAATKLSRSSVVKQVHDISRRNFLSLTAEERKILTDNEHLVLKVCKSRKTQELRKIRLKEVEDDPSVVQEQCKILSEILSKSKHVVAYTGAGISTAAKIPDFRGSEGVWMQINSGKDVIINQNLTSAVPTNTHMCLKVLYDRGIVKHIVSQNCDGLHIRSGIPQHAISEIHGNMYMEVCKDCDKQVYRIFDVTEKTSLHRHKTERICRHCGNFLRDTIVHFGERSNLKWPHNWEGAIENAQKADLILCLGSSLKVMRSYKQLWMMGRPKSKRPALYIVNLQWTPKDSQASMKIHSRVDTVMEAITKQLGIDIPNYAKEKDQLLYLATQCDFGGPTIGIPTQIKTDFCTKTTEKDAPCCSRSTMSAESKKTASLHTADCKLPQSQANVNPLPQDIDGCTEKYAKNEFCSKSAHLCTDTASLFYGDTPVISINSPVPDSLAMQTNLENTSSDASDRNLARELVVQERCHFMDQFKSSDMQSGHCVKRELHPDYQREAEVNLRTSCVIFPDPNFAASTENEVPEQGAIDSEIDRSASEVSVEKSSNLLKIPSWFGKGVRTKLSASRKKKRRKT